MMKRLSLALLLPLFIPLVLLADYSDYFSVTLADKVVETGDTVIITERSEIDDICSYMPHFVVSNQTDNEFLILAAMLYSENPSRSMTISNPDYWGRPQFCMSSCFANGDDQYVGYGTEKLTESLLCFPEVISCSIDASSTYKLKIAACFGTPDNYVEIKDGLFEATLVFTAHDMGSPMLGKDNLPSEYFDLQGRRLSAPTKWIQLKIEHLTDGTIRTTKVIH